MPGADLDVVRDIPGYKLILKAVLKSQIQQLVEQLANHTGEESVILTASVSDGSLSHLGSESGKVFLEDHDDIKSQFLGFCLKRYHTKQKQIEKEKQQQTHFDTGETLRDVPLTQRGSGTGPRPQFFSGAQSAQKHQAPFHPSPSGVHSASVTKAPKAGPNVRHEPYTKNKPVRASTNIYQQGMSSVLESSRQGAVGSVGSHTLKVDPADIKIEAGNTETNSEFSGAGDSLSEADGSSAASIPNVRNVPSSRLTKKSPMSEDSMSGSSNEPADMKFSESMPLSGFGLDSDIHKFSSVAGDSESTADESDNQHENSNMELNIKVEGIRESEMDLETTGVHAGSMTQSDNNWVPDVQDMSSHGISSLEASGSSAKGDIAIQTSQGYGRYFHLPTISCDDNKMYVCIECGQSFSFPSALKVHHRIHAGVKPHVCSECGKSFTQKNNLYRHLRNIHQAKAASSGKELKDAYIKTESSEKEVKDAYIKTESSEKEVKDAYIKTESSEKEVKDSYIKTESSEKEVKDADS